MWHLALEPWPQGESHVAPREKHRQRPWASCLCGQRSECVGVHRGRHLVLLQTGDVRVGRGVGSSDQKEKKKPKTYFKKLGSAT